MHGSREHRVEQDKPDSGRQASYGVPTVCSPRKLTSRRETTALKATKGFSLHRPFSKDQNLKKTTENKKLTDSYSSWS